jgi:tetratricopeptide (TPR) repeat protein
MRKSLSLVALAVMAAGLAPLYAQQPCPSFSIIINTPEDKLMLAVNGAADSPQDQIAALDQFAQANPSSTFMPCVNEYYTATYVKLGNFAKAIEYGEKDLAANYQDVNLYLNLAKAYVGAGQASDSAFSVIDKAPPLIQAESNPPKPTNVSDDEWQKNLATLGQTAKEIREYMEYAFFQLLPRVTDAHKRIADLDDFAKAYPDTPNANQVDFQYLVAYKMAGDVAKADEYGEKALAIDPNNVGVLNTLADDYSVTRHSDLDKAGDYAKKVLDLVPAMKKPDGVSDDQFKADQDLQKGIAHTTLAYIAFYKAQKTRRVAPAIAEFKTAADLLSSNPELQAKALYFLGNAYEFEYPPNHRAAAEALGRASKLASSYQAPARELLAKIPK